MAVPNFLAIPFVLATNLVATLPKQLIKSCDEALNLSISPLPFEMPGFSVDPIVHSKVIANRASFGCGQRWFNSMQVD